MATTDKERISTPEDDNVSSESIDTAHVIGLDLAGAHERFRKQQTDIYDIAEEGLQNAIDSKDIRKPHSIKIYRGRHPTDDPTRRWVLRITDQGDGIAQDYNDDIHAFIEAKKAASEKSKKPFKAGFKGIGMFQFTEIGEKVAIRSMYKGLISKFYMLLKPTGDGRYLSVFTRPVTVAATQENMIKYDIFENGTDIRWYDRPNDNPWMQSKKLIERIREDYGMRLIDNPQLEIIVFNDPSDKRGTRVLPPERMISNPPVTLGYTEDGRHLVRGCIWKDEKSTGKLDAYRGHKIEEVWWDNRQATGYFECWQLDVDSSKNTLVVDRVYNQVRKLIAGILQKFPRSRDETPVNPKESQKVLEMAKIALAHLLPKAPTSYGSLQENDKDESMGDPEGTENIGYRTSKEPNPDRGIIRRKGGPKDLANQTHVGPEPKVPVKVQDEVRDRRQKNPVITYNSRFYDIETPLFIFFPGQTGKGLFKPAELILCMNNSEFPLYKSLLEKSQGGGQAAVQMYIQAFTEIIREAQDPSYRKIRIEDSKNRVDLAKAFGVYPVIKEQHQQQRQQRRLDDE